MTEPIDAAKVSERIRSLMASNAELVAALVEIADPCVLRSGEGFRMIARAALAKHGSQS